MSKVAFITGGSRGIGRAVAEGLLREGFDCSLIALQHDRLNKTASELKEKFPNNKILTFALDISNESSVNEAVNETLKKLGRIDFVLNNAGQYVSGTLDLPLSEFERVMNINYIGAVAVAKAVVPILKKQKSGYLINVSSICGKVGYAEVGAYTGSKYALMGFHDSLFHELADTGVKTTVVCPSWVNTDMAAHCPFPLEEVIQPEDIYKTVSYLLSLSKNACPKEIVVECLKSPL